MMLDWDEYRQQLLEGIADVARLSPGATR